MPPFHVPLYSNQGCVYSFRPSVAPIPPVPPQPPATRPPPPACGVFPTQQGGPTAGASLCTLGGSLNFSNVFSDFAVLQMAPARSAVYGYLGTNATKGGATTVTITVNPVNDAPVADAQSVTTDEDTAVAITLTGLDVDGDLLSYSVQAGPAHGSLTGTGANLTYTPDADYHGPDSFTFVVSDGCVDSLVAKVCCRD